MHIIQRVNYICLFTQSDLVYTFFLNLYPIGNNPIYFWMEVLLKGKEYYNLNTIHRNA